MLTATSQKEYIKSPFFETRSASEEAVEVQKNYLKAVEHFTDTVSTETSEQKFKRLSATWKEDMKFSSSPYSLLVHPSYLGIIAMGKNVIPLIIKDMRESPNHWFSALSILTGENPVKEDDRGNVQKMTATWVNWAESHGYIA